MSYRFTGKERDEETGYTYFGARYLDVRRGLWTQTDPALGEYIPTAGTQADKLPGMGGVYNLINAQLYHYAGNNPVKYTDPDGKCDISQLITLSRNMYITAAVATQVDSPAIGPGDIAGAGIAIAATGVLAYAGIKKLTNYISDSIAQSKARKNNYLLVSHFTSIEYATKIMESGIIEPSKWETNVFVMAEPSTQKMAENAGAKYTSAKITFIVRPTEVIKDPGTDQLGALMFTISGPVNISHRNPVITELE